MGFALAGFGHALRRPGAGARRRAAHRRARALRDVRHEGRAERRARRARAEVLDRVLRGYGARGRHERSHARPAPGGAQGEAARRSSRHARATSGRRSDASTTAASSRCSSPESSATTSTCGARKAFFEIDSPWGRIEQLRDAPRPPRTAHTPAAATRRAHRRDPARGGHRRRDDRRDESRRIGGVSPLHAGSSDLPELLDELPVGDERPCGAGSTAAPRTSPPSGLRSEDLARVRAVSHRAQRAHEIARRELVAQLGPRGALGAAVVTAERRSCGLERCFFGGPGM